MSLSCLSHLSLILISLISDFSLISHGPLSLMSLSGLMSLSYFSSQMSLMSQASTSRRPPCPTPPAWSTAAPWRRSPGPGLEWSPGTRCTSPVCTGVITCVQVYISGLYAGPRSYGPYQKYGGFASYTVAPSIAVERIPAGLSMAEAATLNGAYETGNDNDNDNDDDDV